MTKPNPESPQQSYASKLIARLARSLDQADIGYLLIGGQAVIQQGYVRATEDIDIELTIGPWDAAIIRKICERLDLNMKIPNGIEVAQMSLLLPFEDRRKRVGVDFAFAPSQYLDQAILRAPRHLIHGYRVAVAAVEDLIIRKVIANRTLDRVDIDELLLRHTGRVDLAYIEYWFDQLEQIIDAPLRETFRELLNQSRQ